jgi:hypothetical protein
MRNRAAGFATHLLLLAIKPRRSVPAATHVDKPALQVADAKA